MYNSRTSLFIIGVFCVVSGLMPTATHASILDGTIDPNHTYAWSNNDGWVNWYAATTSPYAVHITSNRVTGYIWDSNSGWINLAPTYGGVINDGNGNLSGFAWGSGTGWINFAGTVIDSNGTFHGTATGNIIGTLTFDCSSCSVSTDWRPAEGSGSMTYNQSASSASTPTTPATTPANSDTVVNVATTQSSAVSQDLAAVPAVTVPTPPVVQPITVQKQSNPTSKPPSTTYTDAVVLTPTPGASPQVSQCKVVHNDLMKLTSSQCGQLTQTMPSIGTVEVKVQAGAVAVQTVFRIVTIAAHTESGDPVNTQFDVSAYDAKTKQAIHQFNNYLQITLPIPAELLNRTNLRLKTKETAADPWDTVPNAQFGTSTVTFFVDHLSLFMIEDDTANTAPIAAVQQPEAATTTTIHSSTSSTCAGWAFVPQWYVSIFGCTLMPILIFAGVFILFCIIVFVRVMIVSSRKRASTQSHFGISK